MALELAATGFMPRRLVVAPQAIEAAFVGFLLLVFVGLTPFSPPLAGAGGIVMSGRGDVLREGLYLGMFAVLLLAGLERRGLGALRLPVSLGLLLAWCVLSAAWADAPQVAFRRAVLEVLLVLSVVLSVGSLGAERSLVLLRTVLLGVLVVNWLSIPLVVSAVHGAGEIDPGLVGDWRGLYGHKNIAGSVAALTAMLFLHSAISRRRAIDALIALLAITFLVMTRSKASFDLLPIALLAGVVYALCWRKPLDRAIAITATALVGGALVLFVVLDFQNIVQFLADPSDFTGRGAIWRAELSYAGDHPLLGAGFGTFADSGLASPLARYAGDNWITAVSHGHSGYLELLVTTGGVGLFLAVLALVFEPLAAFWPVVPERTARKALLFALFVFFVLHNFVESDFLEGDGTSWVAFLIMLAMLRREAEA